MIRWILFCLLFALSTSIYAQAFQTLATPPMSRPPQQDKETPPPPENITAEPLSVFADGWPKEIKFSFTPDSSSCTNASMSPSCSPMGIMPGRWNKYSSLVIKSIHKGPCTVIFTCGGTDFTVTIEKE